MKLIFFILAITTVAFAQAPTSKQDQYNRFKTKIINGGFENGTSQWSASGGVFAVSTTLTDTRSGLRSAIFDPSASSQTLTSAANTVSAGNAQVSCWFKTAATDFEFAAYDGTNKLVTQTIPASSMFQKITLNYALSTAGQLRARITSASNSVALFVDDCFAGEADNVGNGNFATDWSSYTPTYTGFGTVSTSNLFYRRVGDALEIHGSFVSGTPTATEARLSLPTGLTASTTDKIPNLMIAGTWGADTTSIDTFKQVLIEPGLSYVTFSLQNGATADLTKQNGNSIVANGYKVSVKASLPIAGWNSQSVYDASIQTWFVDANIGGANPSLGVSSVSSYTGIEDSGLDLVANTNSLPVKIPCSSTNSPTGSTCSVGNESIGVSFDLPVAGQVEACVQFGHYKEADAVSEALVTTFQIVETASNAQTVLQEGKSRVVSVFDSSSASNYAMTFPYSVCGTFYFSSSGTKTLRLFYEQLVSGTPTNSLIPADRLSTAGQRDIHWMVKPITQNIVMPLLVGGVSAPSATGAVGICSAYVTNGGTCAISRQTGCFSGTSDPGVGGCTMTFVTGAFSPSVAPVCTATITSGGFAGTAYVVDPTTSQVQVFTANSSFTDADHAYEITCIGVK